MSGFFGVLLMSVLLAAASFGIGILPRSFAVSSKPPLLFLSSTSCAHSLLFSPQSPEPALARVSALGTGLLLGAALGVIIPE